jgi:uncharacterized membrane protein
MYNDVVDVREAERQDRDVLKHLTMFAGMYAITVSLFTIETGSFLKGLFVGLIAASLKTVWAQVHHWRHRPRKRTNAAGFDPIDLGC